MANLDGLEIDVHRLILHAFLGRTQPVDGVAARETWSGSTETRRGSVHSVTSRFSSLTSS
eukprot:109886-Rhodomonas_salina.1